MNRVLFRLNCSSYLLAVTIRNHLEKNKNQYPDVVDEFIKNMYVDDWVTTTNDENQLRYWKSKGEHILMKAGFQMKKWKSNATILEDAHEDLVQAKLNKILGISWDSSSDSLRHSETHEEHSSCHQKRDTKKRKLDI